MLKKRRKLHENWLINGEDMHTQTAALLSRLLQCDKQTKKLVFFVLLSLYVYQSPPNFACRQRTSVNFLPQTIIFGSDPQFLRQGPKTLFQVFQYLNFLVINTSFINRILPKLKYRCRPSISINVVSFIIFDPGIRRHGAKIK